MVYPDQFDGQLPFCRQCLGQLQTQVAALELISRPIGVVSRWRYLCQVTR
jgi:hypothetical protein